MPTNTEAIRAYQGGTLGRANGMNCILELLPLPSPSTSQWLYSTCAGIPWLRDRVTYREHVAPSRVRHLQRRIGQHQPEVVVFYGFGYRDWWKRVAEMSFEQTELEGFYIACTDRTVFALTKHPTHTGITNQYFERAGALVRAAVARSPRVGLTGA
ncbi:MAG TPA: hypothetical protein VKK81_28545 [Candidatus Binatia bacterium]|nr:hypothetical protein [Candidatus Binatia bacterium]